MRDLDELLARMGIECSGLADETMTTALGLDSLHMAEIVSHVEVCRGRSVHPDALQGIATLGEFRAWYRDVSGSPI